MRVAIIGYGKMGRTVERIARDRGHEVVAIVDVGDDAAFESTAFASADVAIEFTMPDAAVDNYRKSWRAGVPVVSGTTGWIGQLPALRQEIEKNGHTLFWASNFSLGVNIFFELNRRLAAIMNSYPVYDVRIKEIHHTEKKDAPSGTAITLAEDIISNLDRKTSWQLADNDIQQPIVGSKLPIDAVREGKVPGTHIVEYYSESDSVTIRHEAFSRDGFALGAVIAAEFVVGKTGFFTMCDLMNF